MFDTVPIGMVFRVANGATPKSGEEDLWDGDIPWVTPADLGKNQSVEIASGARSITHKGLDSCGTQIVPAGSIVLSIRAPIGHTAIAVEPMCFNQGCRGLVPTKKVLPKFGYWAILSAKPELQSAGQGTTFQELGRDKLRAVKFPLPDLSTQRQIADFLDRETARLDLLIEKKQRLVALLGEEKDARITHEITGNRREHNDRKASRNAFVSSIPAHWDDAQLKHIVRPGTVITYGIVQAGPEFEGGIPYIRTGDMKGDALPLTGYPLTSPEIAKSYARSALERGDLVMAIRATVGKCLRVPDELIGANLTQGTAKISPGPKVRRDFLFFALLSKPSQSFFDESAKGATFKEITLDRLRRLVIPLPPLREQDRIVKRLQDLEGRHTRATANINTSIDRLKEYRSALITAAVTGQIDVSTYAKSGTPDRRLDAIQEEMGA